MSWRCVLVAVAAVACGGAAPDTADALRDEIAAYRRGDGAATEERIAAQFARLDAEIATLRADELAAAPADRAELGRRREAREAERRELQTAYLEARVARLGATAEEAFRGMAEQLGRGLEDMGRTLRESGRTPDTP